MLPLERERLSEDEASHLLIKHFENVDKAEADRIVARSDQDFEADEVREAMSAVRRLVIVEIEEENPKFFSRFQKMIQSGNHVEIRESMREAPNPTIEASADVLGQSVSAATGENQMRLEDLGTGQGQCITVAVAAAAVGAVTIFGAVNLVGAINTTIAGNYTFVYDTAAVYENNVIWGEDEPLETPQVHREMHIDLIRSRLASS